MDFVAVHSLLAASDDLRLDALRFTPFPPLGATALRQQVCLRAALHVAVVVLPERLGAGSVMTIEIAHLAERLRPASLHRLVFRDQKPPFLKVVPLNCPVVAVVAHRILQGEDSISELVNLHNCEERSDEAIHSFLLWHNGLLRCARNDGVSSPLASHSAPRPRDSPVDVRSVCSPHWSPRPASPYRLWS